MHNDLRATITTLFNRRPILGPLGALALIMMVLHMLWRAALALGG